MMSTKYGLTISQILKCNASYSTSLVVEVTLFYLNNLSAEW